MSQDYSLPKKQKKSSKHEQKSSDKTKSSMNSTANSGENDIAPKEWCCIAQKYEFITRQGKGSYGNVYKARDRETQEIVAVKHMTGIFRHNHHAKKMIREVSLLMQLSSEPEHNLFFTQLIDVIVPHQASAEDDKRICTYNCHVDHEDGQD